MRFIYGPEAGENQVPSAAEYLQKLRPHCPWVLTAIEPDGRAVTGTDGKPITKPPRTWTITARTAAEVKSFLHEHNGKRNLYYSVNPTRRALGKKAAKTDIAAIEYALADLDPAEGESSAEARARYLAQLRNFQPQPTAIVNSGNGIQALWRLKEPIALGEPIPNAKGKPEFSPEDQATIADVEARVEAVMLSLGAKAGTQNVDRILRLPGTINLPNAKKRREGRVECPTELIEFNDLAHPLTAFPLPASAGKRYAGDDSGSEVDIDALRVSRRIKNLICGVEDPSNRYDSRSEEVMAVLVAMAAADHTDAEMTAVMAGAIGDHIRDQSKPEKYLKRQIARARELAADPDVKELNETYAATVAGGRPAILVEKPDEPVELWPVETFCHVLKNRFVIRDGRKYPLAKHWLENPQRRQYGGVEFAPEHGRAGYYNLWNGFSVRPKAGDCSKFLAHIRDNVCQGDEELFAWVIGWFAHVVQKPSEKIGTALVLRGGQGVGKSIVGNVIGSLLGRHYTPVADQRYITGRFNSHLTACLLLQADEGFWAGDHGAEGKLKDLITGDRHLVEYKGREPIELPNFVRLLVTGNHDWLVPAGPEERRFAVVDVGDAHKQDHDYFRAIIDEMNNGGREALLYYLSKYDLSRINLRKIPKTTALLDQKIESLSAERAWWLETLMNGVLPWGAEGDRTCPTEALHESYVKHASQAGIRRRANETQIGMFLHKHIPELRKRRVSSYIRQPGSGRGRAYVFPPLAECRAHFETLIEQKIEWPEPQRDWDIEGRTNVEDEFPDFPPSHTAHKQENPCPEWLN